MRLVQNIFENAEVDLLIIKKTGDIWTKMKDVQDGLVVQNISDLFFKEICGIYKTKSLTKQQIKKYKMSKREIFEKFDNLSEDELNAKNNKEVYVKNDVMTTITKRCRGEKKKRKKIIQSPEYKVKSKIGSMFINEKILEEYFVKVYEIDDYFYEQYRKKILVDENRCKCILFRIGFHFTEHLLAI